MIRKLYDWTMDLAGHRRAPQALFWVAFIESSVFPIPPDVMLMPMVLANRLKAWAYAGVATAGSVLGGIAGYLIGLFLFDLVGRPLLDLYGYGQSFEQFASNYNEHGALIVFFFGVTPFPYKVITIASGVTQLNLLVFVLASIASRGLRFFLVSGLLYWFGPPIRDFIEKRLGLLTILFFVLLFGGFIAARYLV
ncbi:MAG: DedA family protein [Hyphomicrobiaceae bacterium]|nr:DedA family protein [Hyphomicrobiaceae bacterium]